jgi:hypothetical protein
MPSLRHAVVIFSLLLAVPPVLADTLDLQVSNAWVRASLPGQTTTSAFAIVKNPLDKPLKLTAIHSKVAETVELHSHSMANGQMQMRKIDNFSIPAHGEAVFSPGTQHMMLIGVKKPLQENTTVKLEMCFDELCSIIEMPVVSVLNEGKLPVSNEHEHHH